MKCAGSSVEFTLLQHCGEEALCTGGIEKEERSLGYISRNNIFQEDGQQKGRFHSHTWPNLFFERIENALDWKDYTKVTIVRNPWDALVSYYWWWASSPESQSKNSFVNFEITKDDSIDQAKWKFENFINILGKTESVQPNKFGQPIFVEDTPIDYFSKINENFINDSIDIYLSFENLQSDFDKLSNRLGIASQELFRFKTKHRKIKRHYSEYYSQVTRNAVEMRFPKTIEKFGYRFEN